MAEPPRQYREFVERYGRVAEAYEALGEALRDAGPLDRRAAELVKLGISLGMRQEGAVHAHTRKALDAGCTPDELRHAAVLAVTTLGWPAMVAGYMWVEDELASRGSERVVSTEGMD